MDLWIFWRFLKFVGVAAFTAGVLGAVLLPDGAQRRRAAHGLASLGLGVVWISGYALLKAKGLSLGEPWISRSLLGGIAALGGAAWAGSCLRVPGLAGALAFGGLLASFGSMTAQTSAPWLPISATLVGAAAGWVATRGTRYADTPDPGLHAATARWFAWMAWAEGASLLALFGLYMPLKYGAGIVLDGGQGWFGWAHGMLQLLYLVALVSAWRTLGWSSARAVGGFVASLIPFGTFWFERSLRRQAATADTTAP